MLTLTPCCRSVNGLPGSCVTSAPVFESRHVVSFWLSLISMVIHPGLHTIQPGSRAVGTFDDGLLEKVTRTGLAPEDGLIWFIMLPSQKTSRLPLHSPSISCALPSFMFSCCSAKHFLCCLTFYRHSQPHFLTYPKLPFTFHICLSFYLCVSFP